MQILPTSAFEDALSRIISLLFAAVLGIGPASALTVEQATTQCSDTVGRSFVFTCMGPRRDLADLEPCKKKAKPAVVECIKKALNAANGRANVPLATPKETSFEVPRGWKPVPAAFVAPPRTISDIAAILDAEKPDATKIEQLKAEADAQPP